LRKKIEQTRLIQLHGYGLDANDVVGGRRKMPQRRLFFPNLRCQALKLLNGGEYVGV
jgi:hypothetical protein